MCIWGNGSDTLSKLRWLSHALRMGPIFSSVDRVEEASRRPTDDLTVRDKECYGWFEQSGIIAFTWLGSKRYLN